MTADIPSSHADAETFRLGTFPPVLEQGSVLDELLPVVVLARQVGADADIVVLELINGSESFGGENGVDATYFITNLPAGFE